jgi:hypothetical protein
MAAIYACAEALHSAACILVVLDRWLAKPEILGRGY